MRLVDHKGARFGRLLVLRRERAPNGRIQWLCQCDCGALRYVQGSSLVASVGCRACSRIVQAASMRTHGKSRTRIYRVWGLMISRCKDSTSAFFYRYGGRGIKVCERWLKFENFYADMGERPAGKSLDRINNDGNYEPGNCRWATNIEQASNKSNNLLITVDGVTKTASQWSRDVGLSRSMVSWRLGDGWSPEHAVQIPRLPRGLTYESYLALQRARESMQTKRGEE